MLQSAKVAVGVTFVTNGLALTGWLARAPAVRDDLHLSVAGFGLLLLCLSAAAMFPGFLILVPPFWSGYTTTERIKNAQIATGRKDWLEGWITLIVMFMLTPLAFGFVQDQLNKVWQNLGIPTPYEKKVLEPGPGYYAGQYQQEPSYTPQPGGPPPPGHRPPGAPPPPPPA